MSKHSSLKATGTVGGKRSVLKRFERVKLLKERLPLSSPESFPAEFARQVIFLIQEASRMSMNREAFFFRQKKVSSF